MCSSCDTDARPCREDSKNTRARAQPSALETATKERERERKQAETVPRFYDAERRFSARIRSEKYMCTCDEAADVCPIVTGKRMDRERERERKQRVISRVVSIEGRIRGGCEPPFQNVTVIVERSGILFISASLLFIPLPRRAHSASYVAFILATSRRYRDTLFIVPITRRKRIFLP